MKKRGETVERELRRQGDVIFMPIDEVPPGLQPEARDPRGLVLAEGETSGHHHAILGTGAKLFRFREGGVSRILTVARDVEARVVGGEVNGAPRHEPVKIAPGPWEVWVQHEYSSEDERTARRVAD